ncbi:MAG: hypothetical protein JWR35_1475 [Marmoricola sp.]|nr:hypothetical protein [Marmoricola sp.]
MRLACCVDFGSTYTKAALVDTSTGALLATASHRTTIDTDVLDGYDACLSSLEKQHPGAARAEVLACSSAGGGLRIAVIGNEELVTAEAGRRVALSSGGKVVAVLSRPHRPDAFVELVQTTRPDVVLLTGGTDGGNAQVLLDASRELVASGWSGPVVVAGNVDTQVQVADVLKDIPHAIAANVVPKIGVLAPESARRAIREMFLAHVIGGKQLSKRADFTAMVRGATPDLVLTGVELLAESAGDVVVVDVGGATTDVHSVVELVSEDTTTGSGPGLSREVVATTPVTRTVEGDLGMRWSAVTTADAAIEAGLADEALRAHAVRRQADPAFLPATADDEQVDQQLATAAVVLAVRRHVGRSQVVIGPDGRIVERTGKDLREVDVLIGSGGVLRNNRNAIAILEAATGPTTEGWQQPEHPLIVIDRNHVLAAAGLLKDRYPEAALVLARSAVADQQAH